MHLKIGLMSILAVSMVAFPASAEELDLASQEAALRTRQMLENPELREQAVSKSAEAAFMHRQAESLGGSPENTEEIYGLASDIFAELVKQSGGEPLKMMELLEKAKKDPKAFADKLTPEQRERLSRLANKIPESSLQAPAQ